MKNITILGSTGSIGVKALRVIRANPDKYRVVGLAAGKNIQLLKQQMDLFRPKAVAVLDQSLARALKKQCSADATAEIFFGSEGFVRLASSEQTHTVISAMTGAAGLLPTYEAIKAGKDIALANKETMVMAGSLVMTEVKKKGVALLPIDSEHCAILQSLQGHRREDLKRVILTASGGPFRELPLEEMSAVGPDQALRHPNWNMGAKITIDSATMMNKGLEAIEAKWLFDLNMDQISIVVHKQSIVHSMVEYHDGSIIAQLGIPDMTIPISYALSYPRHLVNKLPRLELEKIGHLSFEPPDLEKFKCLDLALKAIETGDTMPAVLNGANELAVASFLEGEIAFLDIPRIIEKCMDQHQPVAIEDIETVMEMDAWARQQARNMIISLS